MIIIISIKGLLDNTLIKQTKICLIGFQEGEERKRRAKYMFDKKKKKKKKQNMKRLNKKI